MQDGHQVIGDSHEHVVILFSDIVGFSTMASTMSAVEVFLMLSNLYYAFDRLVDKYGVYKVETIGDGYMLASGECSLRCGLLLSIAYAADPQYKLSAHLLNWAQVSRMMMYMQLQFSVFLPIVRGNVCCAMYLIAHAICCQNMHHCTYRPAHLSIFLHLLPFDDLVFQSLTLCVSTAASNDFSSRMHEQTVVHDPNALSAHISPTPTTFHFPCSSLLWS